MHSILLRSTPSVLHVIITMIYFNYILGSNGDYLETRLIIGFVVLILINTIASTFISRGQWRQLLITLISYIIFFFLYLIFLVVTGDPSSEVDDNPSEGLVLIGLGIPSSVISLILGTLLWNNNNKIHKAN
jgi:hypothetical protein